MSTESDNLPGLLRRREEIRYADPAARELLGPLLTDGTQDHWQLVKHNPSRSVYRSDNGQGLLYLKCFHSGTLVHRLERRLGRCDALREMAFSQYLRKNNVPVPTVLAACPDWNISEGIAPAQNANQWHLEQLKSGNHRAIKQAAAALARLIGRMHAAGVLHQDLHLGNVLISPGDPSRVHLMDLHRMVRRWRPGRVARAANLAQLLSDRLHFTTRTEQLRFLRDYLQASGAKGSLRGWARTIQPLLEAHRRRLSSHHDRRVFATNRYFARMRIAGYRAHVVRRVLVGVPGSAAADMTFDDRHWQEVLAKPDALFTGPDVEVIKDSPSSLVVRRLLKVGPNTVDVFLKRSRRKKPIRLLLDLFRKSRALRAFRLGHALLNRRIATAIPLAAMEKRVGGVLVDSILITEAVDSGLELNRFLNRYLGPRGQGTLPGLDPGQLTRKVLWQLGGVVWRLHSHEFYHRDLKAENVLVRWDGQENHWPDMVLIDLDGLKSCGCVSRRQQLHGLMRLNVSLLECQVVSHAGRLRMLLGYLRASGAFGDNFKPYWRVLQTWSQSKIRRQIRSRQRRQKVQRRRQP